MCHLFVKVKSKLTATGKVNSVIYHSLLLFNKVFTTCPLLFKSLQQNVIHKQVIR